MTEIAGVRVVTPWDRLRHPAGRTTGAGVIVVPVEAPLAELAAALDAAMTTSLDGAEDPMGAEVDTVLQGLGVRSTRAKQQRGLVVHVRRRPDGSGDVEPMYPSSGGWISEPEQRIEVDASAAAMSFAEAVVAVHDDMATRRPRARR